MPEGPSEFSILIDRVRRGSPEAARELVERAVDFWKVIDQNRAMMDKPMERAGRKANPLVNPEEAIV